MKLDFNKHKTSSTRGLADEVAAAAVGAHERISVIVNDMNVVKTAIELKFAEVQGEIKAALDKKQADLNTTFEQIKFAFDGIRAAARAEFADIRATAGAELQAPRGHIELWAIGFETKMESKAGSGDFGRGDRSEKRSSRRSG